MATSAFDQDPNLEDDYRVFADNVDLEDVKDKADLDGVAEILVMQPKKGGELEF